MVDVSVDPTLATDGMVSLFVTAISFGLYLASFAHCVRWLLFEDSGWRVRKKIHWTLVTTTLLVFFLSTASFSTTAAGISQTPIFVTGIDSIPAYLWVATILDNSNALYSSILIIIDSVLIHRCWIVFSKNWFIVCFPLALWCSCLVCTIFALYCTISSLLSATDPMTTDQVEYQSKATKALLTFYVCNIVVSVYTTTALVFRIWSAAKNNVGTNRLYRTSRIVTESGILYTLSSVLYLACLIKGIIGDSYESFLLAALLNSIVRPVGIFMPGISFNLITIRVGEQRARGQDTWVDSKDASKILMPSGLLNHPDTSVQPETESANPGREEHERIDKKSRRSMEGSSGKLWR